MRESRTYFDNRQRAYSVRRKKAVLKLGFIICIICLFTAVFFINRNRILSDREEMVTAEFDHDTKYYTTISVKSNDSLWSITSDYRDKGYSTQEEYIDEIKSINGLRGNSIKAGSSLIVAYYSYDYIMSASED